MYHLRVERLEDGTYKVENNKPEHGTDRITPGAKDKKKQRQTLIDPDNEAPAGLMDWEVTRG